jgi:phytoene dehydrogenase-like protein
MLEGKYVTDEYRRFYKELPIFAPVVQVSLGINRDLSAEPHCITQVLDRPVSIAGQERDSVTYKHYCYDPSLAPQGKSVVTALLVADYDYWKTIGEEPERYEAEKQATATAIIDLLECHYPGITADVEAVDVATPLTTERYTGNWRGSIEGWMFSSMQIQMSKSLPGLDDFYMAGQWVEPGGGLPGVAPSGRKLIQILCHRDGKRFVTSVPG